MFKFLWVTTFTIVCSGNPFYLKAQFSDDFSDSNFTLNPPWSGTDTKFVISSEQMKLQAPAAGTAYLSTPSESIDEAMWQFEVRLEFNPSGSNYTRVYLTSDKADLAGPLNGYFVIIGDATDEISLYRQSGTTRTKIIDGADRRIDMAIVTVGVKVTRDQAGNWELFSDTGLTGTYFLEGKATDVTHVSSSFTGIYCLYTATRSDKFFFDNFSVTGKKAELQNLILPSSKDVIITEIFADPSPKIDLPDYEFIELYNRSTYEFNLSNWQLTDGSSVGRLPAKTIKPGDYLILTSTAGASAFSAMAEIVGVPNFPSLNNAGDALVLKASNGIKIDSVSYSDTWYHDDEKTPGGWSLELIDPENLCSAEGNWSSSEDNSGGTPGRKNSIYANKPDLIGPKLISAIPISPVEIALVFNEALAKALPTIDNFIVTPGVNSYSARFTDSALKSVRLLLTEKLQAESPYTIQITSIYDCSGNIIQPEFSSCTFGLPQQAASGDLVINEVLFNPKSPGVDFVEVYNKSVKFINLKNWAFSNLDNDTVRNKKTIIEEDLLLAPKRYLVLTPEGATLKGQYTTAPEENFFKTDLPSMPDEEGSIALLDEQGFVIDYFLYNEKMHSPFLNNTDGVSLERVSFSGSTNEAQNWKSGASATGYATPGYPNSNAKPDGVYDQTIAVSPEIFQPVYGQPDFTQIQYKFEQGGWIANVRIHDSQGRLVKEIANNEVLGTEGFYRWDGDQTDGTKARIGYYFVWFEAFNSQGKVKTFRRRIIVAGSF